ncbi:MAG: Rieske 2Fe-2S domain-containing protein [Myxococcota bacterium]|nr:Rieske 2Fe-2S domain-containing protein [Myxococcota bacterium]
MSKREREHTELPIPNGWFAVAWSKDLAEGQVQRVDAFEEELVLFRGRSGKPIVLDAFCPHMGAHLAEGGMVVGDGIRCPFHGWRFDESGTCVEIPYCKRIPARARTRPWECVERNHMIFVWRHAEGKPPDWEVPSLPEFDDPSYTEPRFFDIEMPVHMQEMAENNCDPAHFATVHGNPHIPDSEMQIHENGRFFRMTSWQEAETPFGTHRVDLERDSWSLGVTSVRMKGMGEAGLLFFSSTTPIDTHTTHSRWAFTVSRNLADVAGEPFIKGMTEGVKQDLRIWKNKIHRARPVFCEADEHLAAFRKWTRQFYSHHPLDEVDEGDDPTPSEENA